MCIHVSMHVCILLSETTYIYVMCIHVCMHVCMYITVADVLGINMCVHVRKHACICVSYVCERMCFQPIFCFWVWGVFFLVVLVRFWIFFMFWFWVWFLWFIASSFGEFGIWVWSLWYYIVASNLLGLSLSLNSNTRDAIKGS
jgi:hypothetical protein